MLLALFFFLKVALAIWGLLLLHINFSIKICFISVRILIGIALTLLIALGIMNISTILIFPVHKNRISSHLFVSSSICLLHIFYFSIYRSYTSLVKFILRYFILFNVIVNKIFLISLSDSSLLVYRNMTDFWVLICILQLC